VHGRNNRLSRWGMQGVFATDDARAPRDVRGHTLPVRFEIVDRRPLPPAQGAVHGDTAQAQRRGPYTVAVSLQVRVCKHRLIVLCVRSLAEWVQRTICSVHLPCAPHAPQHKFINNKAQCHLHAAATQSFGMASLSSVWRVLDAGIACAAVLLHVTPLTRVANVTGCGAGRHELRAAAGGGYDGHLPRAGRLRARDSVPADALDRDGAHRDER